MGAGFTIEAIGQVLRRGAQSYECVAFRSVVRKDGSPSTVAVLRSQCAECGADFTCTSASHGARFQPNRRCDEHKAAGVPLGLAKNFLADNLRSEIKRLKAEMAGMAKRLAAAERNGQALARRLARYELTDAESQRFAALCAERTRERRGHIARASIGAGE